MNLLITLFQDSSAFDAGYNIGYIVGMLLPIVVFAVIVFLSLSTLEINQKNSKWIFLAF